MRVSGVVTDLGGNRLDSVALHVIYDVENLAGGLQGKHPTEPLDEPCSPEDVTFYRTPVPSSDCAVMCENLPTIVRVCPNPEDPLLDPTRLPILSVVSGCTADTTNCDSNCALGQYIYNPDPFTWVYDPLVGCFFNVIIGMTDGCVCITLEGFLATCCPGDFSGTSGDNEVHLTWTATNVGGSIAAFRIVRDSVEIGIVVAENDTSEHSYDYRDETAMNGTEYVYCLRIENHDQTILEGLCVSVIPGWQYGPAVSFELHQSYPNPFDTVTNIAYDIPQPAMVQIELMSSLGVELDILVNEASAVGRHILSYDFSAWPNGLYKLHMLADTFEQTRTMLKNLTDVSELQFSTPSVWTEYGGQYELNIAAGDTIDSMDDLHVHQGSIVLRRATVVAIRDGYLPSMQGVDLVAGQSALLNFVLDQE